MIKKKANIECNRFVKCYTDKEVPRITNCPSSLTIYLEPGQSSQIVTWNEPIFTDNVEVINLNKSRVSRNQFPISAAGCHSQRLSVKEPGELFQAGYHDIVYEAQDGAGNQAKCQFTIHVTGMSYKENLPGIPKVNREKWKVDSQSQCT